MGARKQILEAADRLFGEEGFDAATTREIAELSQVNKALIHYHFKSKEALFEAVLGRYYERLNATLMTSLAEGGSASERIARTVDVYVDFLSQNRNFSRIVQRESAGGRHIGLIRNHLESMFKAGIDLLHEAYPKTRAGDMAAHHLLVSFYGMIVSWFTYSEVLGRLRSEDPLSDEELQRRKAHLRQLTEVILKEIAPEG